MKVGVLLNNLGPSQLAYSVMRTGEKAAEHGVDMVAFYERQVRPCLQLKIASMHIAEAYGYGETLIATDLSTATKLLTFPKSNKFFYIWDLEWTRRQYLSSVLQKTYRNPSLKLIARSSQMAEIISQVWNVNIHGIVDDFHLEELITCF